MFLEFRSAPGQSNAGSVSGHEPQQVEVVELAPRPRRGGRGIGLGWQVIVVDGGGWCDRLSLCLRGGGGGEGGLVPAAGQGGHEALHVLRGHPVSSLRHLRSGMNGR